MTANLLHLPVLSTLDFGVVRSPGPGLGNLLFPIGRALIGQSRLGGLFVRPTVRQIKFGPILRRERDWRTYGNVLKGRDLSDWTAWLKARTLPALREGCNLSSGAIGCIRYEGLGCLFHDLSEGRDIVRSWIKRNAILHGSISDTYDIAIHVRLGDYARAEPGRKGAAFREGFDWYRRAYEEARILVGCSSPSVVLFTDEHPSHVEPLLRIGLLRRDPSENAITAMLNMARARVIITSRSTFSMWGVFLSDAAALWSSDLGVTDFLPLRVGYDIVLS